MLYSSSIQPEDVVVGGPKDITRSTHWTIWVSPEHWSNHRLKEFGLFRKYHPTSPKECLFRLRYINSIGVRVSKETFNNLEALLK
jgi:hypothetical protein